MKMKNYFRFVVFALLGLLNAQWASAQDVTISPTTGHLVAAYTSGSEVGGKAGWSSLWRHEQLPLSVTVADDPDLTPAGEIANPAGNLYNKNGQFVVLGGQIEDGRMMLSLPKGYRFTGYKIVLANDNVGTNFPAYGTIGGVQKSFYETGSDWDYTNFKARAERNGGTWTMSSSNEANYEYVIERYKTEGVVDMGNQLYFLLRLHEYNSAYAVLTIKSFEVYFTAEGSFEAPIVPEIMGPARSLVTSAFETNKMDLGAITPRRGTDNKYYYTYSYENVKDLKGYNYLYQSDALLEDTQGNTGVRAADVAEDKHIYPVKVDGENLYAFGNGTYYVEPPTIIHSTSGLEIPVGYRVVGAKFNYLWGSETPSSSVNRTMYRIRYRRNNYSSWYYLNDNLQFVQSNSPYGWTIDDANNICSQDGRYLACTGSGNTRTLSWSTDKDNWYNLKLFDNQYIGWADGNYYLLGNTNGATPSVYSPGASGVPSYAATTNEFTGTVTIPGYSPGKYTLTVYKKDDKDGTNVLTTINVNSSSDAGPTKIFDMGKCNNDAVKFKISGLPEGKKALVKVTLILEALNPYVNSMSLVCHDPDDVMQLSQSFTVSDFKVSGGQFKFYVPQQYNNTNLKFTFSDLYSKYSDETYYDGTGKNNGRYSFVTSSYFTPINGNGNGGLYDAAYNADAGYENKVVAGTAGNIRFKFNNAENLSNTGGQTGKSYLQEYPFSVSKYIGSDDPDGTTTKGAFIDCTMKPSDNKTGTFYVFTADETRYNIAPTTSWQHRSYAFYRLVVELEAKTYTPTLAWTKLYDKTCYYKDGKDAEDSMWGLKLGTTETKGYLSVQQIQNAINNDTNAPTNTDQILYIDGSDLKAIISDATYNLSTLKQRLGANALIFLPTGTTSKLNNCVYKTATGDFRAGDNIVLTDRKPFYSPYDIIVDDGSYATYTRNITWPRNGKTALATVMVPFTLSLENGVHTEPIKSPFAGCEFTVSQMNASNCLEVDHAVNTNAEDFYAKSYFTPLGKNTDGTFDATVVETVANTPYMINVTSAPNDPNVPFAATQFGALVKATTAATTDNPQGMQTDYTFNGESATGTIVSSVSFKNHGSYSGKKLKASDGYFYFSGGMYLNSKNIRIDQLGDALYMYPFRGYYTYTGGGNAKMMLGFDIAFGENTTTGIADLTDEAVADLVAIPGRGTITFKATADNDVQIVKANGIAAGRVVIAAGETKTINVPAGLYIVNGAKLIVK